MRSISQLRLEGPLEVGRGITGAYLEQIVSNGVYSGSVFNVTYMFFVLSWIYFRRPGFDPFPHV